MIVNTDWLLDYVTPRPPLPVLLGALTRTGLDIEQVSVLQNDLAAVRIGFVRTKELISGTSNSFLCSVEVGPGEPRQIVCASEHPLEVGWGVPVALAGTELPTGISIREEHFHGVLSQGMICLDGELGMTARTTGLQVFHDEALMGRSLPNVAELTQALVHLKVPPNRPDCLGLIGIAREVAAILGLKLVLPQTSSVSVGNTRAIDVDILDPDACFRYTCQTVTGVNVTKSPAWLHSRLLATGSRPINSIVDITNFVLNEWGHPLHAFDLSAIRERIVVRRCRPGESLELLDGRTVTSEHEPLVIADSREPIALAGIMGGRATAIGPRTTDVLLESAYFEPTQIRRTSRSLGLSTDASHRFERGMDPNETLDSARDRAMALLMSLGAGQSAGPISDNYPRVVNRVIFSLRPERLTKCLGIVLSEEKIRTSLEALGHRCTEGLERIEVPTRRVDVNDPVGLIEDVARLVGFETIDAVPGAELPTPAKSTRLDAMRADARSLLKCDGYMEVRGLALEPVDSDSDFMRVEGNPIRLVNPLTVELGQLRRSLMPSLLSVVAHNARRRSTIVRYFEIDKCFSLNDQGGAEEKWAIAILMGGGLNDSDWSTRRDADFFDLKGVVESLLESICRQPFSFRPGLVSGYAGSTVAQIMVGDSCMGQMGQVSKKLLETRKIPQTLFGAEIFIDGMISSSDLKLSKPIPRFPAVVRDLSFVVRKEILYSEIETTTRTAAGSYLESVNCIDVFEGRGVSTNNRSCAISLVFRAPDRTLSSEEVTVYVDNVVALLTTELGAELRDH